MEALQQQYNELPCRVYSGRNAGSVSDDPILSYKKQIVFMQLLKITGICLGVLTVSLIFLSSGANKNESKAEVLKVDFSQIPHDKFGDEVKYGRDLMMNTAYYIGPEGVNGKY